MEAFIIGAGLSGAVVARELAEAGWRVHIAERRNHIGGNMYDYVDEHGILVHKYGPHTFHTSRKELYEYICQYSSWNEYKLECGAEINGKCTPTPFNFQTVDDFFEPQVADEIKRRLLIAYPNREMVTVVEALKSDDMLVHVYVEFLYQNDYSLYTAKQWGVSPEKIDPSVLERVPLRLSYKTGYFEDEFQVMPTGSYESFFVNLLKHRNITISTNTDAFSGLKFVEDTVKVSPRAESCVVVNTGALDELFQWKFGELPYRSLNFEWRHEDIDSRQKMAVVAYPQAEGYTRIVEFKKLPYQNVMGTSYEIEYPIPYVPGQKNEPYYPILTEESNARYLLYKNEADKYQNLFLCGRLAEFKYYNMDQALERALNVSKKIIELYGA